LKGNREDVVMGGCCYLSPRDGRWLLDRNDSPWYPTARLFRQDDARAWDTVIARVGPSLNAMFETLPGASFNINGASIP